MRQFYRIPLICIVLSLIVLCVGCTIRPDVKKEATKKQPVPLAGGRITYGSLHEPSTLNPLLSDMVSTNEIASLIFSGLTLMNDKGEWLPDLARDIPTLENGGISADGRVVTYKLRNNAVWHDGKPFTADDVFFTWRVIMNPRNAIVSREGYDQIISIDTPDAYTVVLHFREYYAPFLTLFSRIMPKHILEAADFAKTSFHRAPIGTGPFVFNKWHIAEDITLDANPHYHLGKPTLTGITYKFIPDTNILLTQLKAGGIDIVGNLDISLLDQVNAIDTVVTVANPTMIWEHMDLNLDRALFRDIKVRQAIALGLDRQTIVKNACKGIAAVAVGDQWPLSWASRTDLQPTNRDVTAARDLLTQAGWKAGSDGIFVKDGLRLSFSLVTTTGNKMRELAVQTITQQLKEIGIEVIPRYVEVPQLFGDILPNRRFDSALYAWYVGADPDNSSLWHSRNIPGPQNAYKGKNYPGWRNPEVDGLVDQAAKTVDMAARKALYFRIQELIQQEQPAISLYFHSNVGAVKKNVLQYRPNAAPSGNLWNSWQWALTAQ